MKIPWINEKTHGNEKIPSRNGRNTAKSEQINENTLKYFKNEWKNHRKSYEIGKNNQKCGMQVFSEIHEAR